MLALTRPYAHEATMSMSLSLLQTSRLKQRVPAAGPGVTVMTEIFFGVAAKHLAFVAADGTFYC